MVFSFLHDGTLLPYNGTKYRQPTIARMPKQKRTPTTTTHEKIKQLQETTHTTELKLA